MVHPKGVADDFQKAVKGRVVLHRHDKPLLLGLIPPKGYFQKALVKFFAHFGECWPGEFDDLELQPGEGVFELRFFLVVDGALEVRLLGHRAERQVRFMAQAVEVVEEGLRKSPPRIVQYRVEVVQQQDDPLVVGQLGREGFGEMFSRNQRPGFFLRDGCRGGEQHLLLRVLDKPFVVGFPMVHIHHHDGIALLPGHIGQVFQKAKPAVKFRPHQVDGIPVDQLPVEVVGEGFSQAVGEVGHEMKV